MRMMASSGQVCRFFLEGRCKFGAHCRFRHPSDVARRGGGGWDNRRGAGGRHQGDPVDLGRRWDQRGGNRFQLFSDSGGGYNSGKGWDDRGQNHWRGGGRVGTRGGGRGGWGGGTRQSSNYQNQRYGNDQYQNDGYSGDRYQQNWSTRGRGRGLFSNNQRSSNYHNSYQRDRYGPASYEGHQQQVSETVQLSDPGEIAAQIRLDMKEWSNSSMWPLSCYAYFKETPCLSGFADVSPEELRWEAYQAKASGNSQQYLRSVSQLNDARLKVMHEFSNLTQTDVRDMLMSQKSGTNSFSQSFFAPTTAATTVSSLFGNTTTNSSLFGSQKQSSLFASPPSTTLAQPLFMQTTARSLFRDMGSQDMLTKQNLVSTPMGLGGQQQVNQVQTTQLSQPQQSNTSALTNNSVAAASAESTKLTDKELEAFKAAKFVLGQIPEHAPPDVLCY